MAEHEAQPVRNALQTTNIGGGYVEVLQYNLSHYAKFLIPLISAALITFQQVSGHGSGLFIALSIAVAIVQAIITYSGSQGSSIPTSVKFWANVAGAIAQAILALVGSGGSLADITPTGWATIGLAAISALGVAIIPNGVPVAQEVFQAGAPDPVTGQSIITPLNSGDAS